VVAARTEVPVEAPPRKVVAFVAETSPSVRPLTPTPAPNQAHSVSADAAVPVVPATEELLLPPVEAEAVDISAEEAEEA
jgi:hypothetical protein